MLQNTDHHPIVIRFIIFVTFFLSSERQSVKAQLYNFSDITADREWLYDAIMSDTDSETDISDEDDYIKDMLRTHIKQQKLRENFYKKPTVSSIIKLFKNT